MIITKEVNSYWSEQTENTDNLPHSDFRLRHNTVSTRWVYGLFLFYPYLIARLWVSHCNAVYHTEYAMNAKTQKQTVVCVWAWISNKKSTLNKYKHWYSWSHASINSLRPNDAIYMATQIWVKIGLSYGLVASGTKPLAKPIDGLTHWHLRDLNKILDKLFKGNLNDWWLSYMLRNFPPNECRRTLLMMNQHWFR